MVLVGTAFNLLLMIANTFSMGIASGDLPGVNITLSLDSFIGKKVVGLLGDMGGSTVMAHG